MSRSLLALCALLQYCGQGERDRVREWKKRKRETVRNTIRYQSSQCTADRVLIVGREVCGSEKREEKGSVYCLKRGAWSIGIPTLRGEWGGWSFEVVSVFQLDVLQSKKKKFKQLSVSVCLPLSLSPLAFPLIFNKQQLRLSATGRQFVPTTKNHGNNHWKSLSGSKGPPFLASPTHSALCAFCKLGWNGRLESISKWPKTRWWKFVIKKLNGFVFVWESRWWLKIVLDHLWWRKC